MGNRTVAARVRQDMTGSSVLTILVVMAILAGCGAGSAGRLAVSGHAVAGPVCPVESPSPDPSCADRPVEGAVLIIRDESGDEVGRTTTDPQGRFSFDLLPGSYALIPQPVEGLLGTASPIDIELLAGEAPPTFTVTYDTGIR